jgi:uncharacterized protein YkwD
LKEGREVVEEAMRFLKSQKAVGAVEWSQGLWKACRDHGEEQAASGAVGHTSANGDTPFVRMSAYSQLVPPAGENLLWGPQDPKDAIIQLLIDDGVNSRGHRLNIFREDYFEHGSYFI